MNIVHFMFYCCELLIDNAQNEPYKENVCQQRNVQITKDKVTECICVLEVRS
jgi:hypothetical protein